MNALPEFVVVSFWRLIASRREQEQPQLHLFVLNGDERRRLLRELRDALDLEADEILLPVL
ncbi:MAG: hypothetical protein KY476_03505 [Planctomycetes bacterium]|nr:hypothetical protein [Planctomycetota bacterium]